MTAITLTAIARRKQVTAKLAGMRKEQTFSVYPRKAGQPVVVQSERAIGTFHPETGLGVLNWRGSGAKYFAHLHAFTGAEPFTFPPDFVKACRDISEAPFANGDGGFNASGVAIAALATHTDPAPAPVTPPASSMTTPLGNPVRPQVTVPAALREVAKRVEFRDSTNGEDLYNLVCTTGASAATRFRVFNAIRKACLGSSDAGDLSGWLMTHDRFQLIGALERAATELEAMEDTATA